MASNNLLQYNIVAKESLRVLANTLGYARHVHTKFVSEYTDKRHGSQITIPRPPRYTVRRGDAMQTQGITIPDVVVTVQEPLGVDLQLTYNDMQLVTGKMPEFSESIIKPAMSQLASVIDNEIANAARREVYNYVGTAGVAPTTLTNLLAATQRLNEEGAPQAQRVAVFGPRSHASMVNGLSGNFVQHVINRAERYADLDFPVGGTERIIMSQSTPAHTVGIFTGAPVVDGPAQNGSSLRLRGWVSGDVLNEGDVIQIAGVRAINYQTRQSTGVLRQFVIRAQAVANAAGIMDVSIYPPISPPLAGVAQQFQTVDSFPADGAAVTVVTGTTGAVNQENIVFEKNALGLISLPQILPPDAYYARMETYEGLGLRFWMGSDIFNNRALMRIDWLGATPVLYPETATRMAG
jgi:hypothetical protein